MPAAMLEKIGALADGVANGHVQAIARALTWVDNSLSGYEELLKSLKPRAVPVIGLTGPPGAGKSTLANALIGSLLKDGKRVALLAVDPSSPFHLGALLGDRIRLTGHALNPNLFIRSFASRGSLGGLSASLLQAMDVMRAAPFDVIFVETVGVGQSEIEIAGLADVTVLVLVPEAGDEVQGIKSGIMEIADVIAVNKADRPESEGFAAVLRRLVHERSHPPYPPVIKTTAIHEEGTVELWAAIQEVYDAHFGAHQNDSDDRSHSERKTHMLFERALTILAQRALAHLPKETMKSELAIASKVPDFNLYAWLEKYDGNRFTKA